MKGGSLDNCLVSHYHCLIISATRQNGGGGTPLNHHMLKVNCNTIDYKYDPAIYKNIRTIGILYGN